MTQQNPDSLQSKLVLELNYHTWLMTISEKNMIVNEVLLNLQ